MSEQFFKFKEKFDPEEWSGVYDFSKRNNKNFIFRHGSELVEDTCSKISRPNELWLDIGCGTGDLAVKLSEMGLSVIGVDHDPRMIEFANKRFLWHSIVNRLTFTTAKAEFLPFVDNSTDGIVAASLAGCLSLPDKFFQEAYRVLRKNGFAIITFTNRTSLLLKINWCLNKTLHMIRKPTDSDDQYQLYACTEIADKLQKIGFRILNTRFYNFFLNAGDRMIPPKWLAIHCERFNKYKMGHRVGGNFIIVAQKI